MKRLFIGGHNPSGTIFGSSEPGLRAHLAEHFEIVQKLDSLSQDDYYVALDANQTEIKLLEKMTIPVTQRALIAFEPEVVLPWQTLEFASRHFSFTRWMGRPKSSTSEFWPQIFELGTSGNLNLVDCTMMTSNKLSFVRGELYSLRREAIKNITGLKLVGSGWQSSFSARLMSYLRSAGFHLAQGKCLEVGNFDFLLMSAQSHIVENKISWLSNCRLSLVFENSTEYSSEKVFDCIRSFTIPVYVGAENSMPIELEKLIFRAEPNIRSVIEVLELAKSANYEEWCQSAVSVLGGDGIRDQVEERSVFARLSKDLAQWAS